MSTDLSHFAQNLPDKFTPLDVVQQLAEDTLEQWGDLLEAVRQAAASTQGVAAAAQAAATAAPGTATAAAVAAVAPMAAAVASARAEVLAHVDVLAAPSDGQVAGYVQGVGGTLARTALDGRFATEAIAVQAFGAVGDGVTDDTAALNAAINSGRSLLFGDATKTYLVSAMLQATLTRRVQWSGRGARILLVRETSIERTVDVISGGHSLHIAGLRIDANRKAHVGIYVTNSTATYATLTLDDLHVSNVYRSSTTFIRGDGIFIRGAFDRVAINRPVIREVVMAAGAGVIGNYGITGITTYAWSTTRYPKVVTITDAVIENVYSEDPAYVADQDGIRILAPEDVGSLLPYEHSFTITGGKFTNCQGRTIKAQAEYGFVRDISIFRSMPRSSKSGADIDFQVGGGMIEDVFCQYVGDAPSNTIIVNSPATVGKQYPQATVRGIRVLVTGEVSPDFVVAQYQRTGSTSTLWVDDVELSGTPPQAMIAVHGVAGGVHNAFITRVVGQATAGFLQARTAGGWTGKWSVRDCINTSSTAAMLVNSISTGAIPEVTASGCTGFQHQKSNVVDRHIQGGFTRVAGIAPVGLVASGVLRPVSFDLADGATFQFPESFYFERTGMLLVSVGSTRTAQGFFACDSGGVTTLAAGADFAVGTTTEPASGSYRLWSGTTGPRISNRSGASRTFTCYMVG